MHTGTAQPLGSPIRISRHQRQAWCLRLTPLELIDRIAALVRLITFVTEGTPIRKILDHIGVDSEPSHIAPARGPPLWDDGGDALAGEGDAVEPDWDLAAHPHLTTRLISALVGD